MSIGKETDMESCKKQTADTFENGIILWAYAREFQWEE